MKTEKKPKPLILTKTIEIEVYPTDAPKLMNWQEAMDYAESIPVIEGEKLWRLPTIEELNLIYDNKDKIKGLNLSGSYPAGYYWSSSPYGNTAHYASIQSFDDGTQNCDYRSYGLSVRLVRSLTI